MVIVLSSNLIYFVLRFALMSHTHNSPKKCGKCMLQNGCLGHICICMFINNPFKMLTDIYKICRIKAFFWIVKLSVWLWVVSFNKVIFSWPHANSFPCVNIIILLTRHKTLNNSLSWHQSGMISDMPSHAGSTFLVFACCDPYFVSFTRISLNRKAPCRSNYTNVIFTLTGPYVPIGETTLPKMRLPS